jgi:hypothetical protein
MYDAGTRITLGVAALLFLASVQWLSASCTVDEPTSTVFRLAPAGDWCKQSDPYANCYYIRATFASGQKLCDVGENTDYNVPPQGCAPGCTGVTALRHASGGGNMTSPNAVTLWRCESAATDCP